MRKDLFFSTKMYNIDNKWAAQHTHSVPIENCFKHVVPQKTDNVKELKRKKSKKNVKCHQFFHIESISVCSTHKM